MKKFFAIFFIVVLILTVSTAIWAQAQEATDAPGTEAAPAAASDEPTDQVQSDQDQAETRKTKTPEEHRLRDARNRPYKVRVHRSAQGEKRIDILTTGGKLYSYYPTTGRQAAFNGAPGANAQLQQPAGVGTVNNYNFNAPTPAIGTTTNPTRSETSKPMSVKEWWEYVRSHVSGGMGTVLLFIGWCLLIGLVFLAVRALIRGLQIWFPNIFPVPIVVPTPPVPIVVGAAPAAPPLGIPAAVPGGAGPLPLNGGAAAGFGGQVVGTPTGTLVERRIA